MLRFGKLNYHAHGKTIDWARFARDASALLDSLGKQYYLKADLRAYIQ